jgi:bifunctional DNA-binding transcriptional regulator/antitoxin component of YhaV-PrlF toxin-antitoxin module
MAIAYEEIKEGRRGRMESKRISVSAKRQITIPQKFYEELGIGNEVECVLRGNELVIRPVESETEFAEEILRELVFERQLSGPELFEEFKRMKAKVRPAVERMMEHADLIAQTPGTGDDQTRDIFGED